MAMELLSKQCVEEDVVYAGMQFPDCVISLPFVLCSVS